MIIEKLRHIQTVLRLRPIAEQYRYRGKHLHIDMMMVAFLHAHSRVPAVVLYLSEELVILHHPRAAWLVMLQMDEAPIAELLAPARQVLRDDVCMYIYFK